MERPYIVCHMVASVDGKVTGDFLFRSESADATAIYYRLNREMKADGYICGRVTMAESFTGGFYPELDCYEPLDAALCKEDYLADCSCGFYAIAFDTKGRLGWQSNRMIDPDGDEGYDGEETLKLIAAGKLNTEPLITHTYPLAKIDETYELFENKCDGVIKVAVEC